MILSIARHYVDELNWNKEFCGQCEQQFAALL